MRESVNATVAANRDIIRHEPQRMIGQPKLLDPDLHHPRALRKADLEPLDEYGRI